MTEIDALDDNARYIDELRTRLGNDLLEAQNGLRKAQITLRELQDDHVYDIEFVEGPKYIDDAVRHAALYVASSLAMHDVLVKPRA